MDMLARLDVHTHMHVHTHTHTLTHTHTHTHTHTTPAKKLPKSTPAQQRAGTGGREPYVRDHEPHQGSSGGGGGYCGKS